MDRKSFLTTRIGVGAGEQRCYWVIMVCMRIEYDHYQGLKDVLPAKDKDRD